MTKIIISLSAALIMITACSSTPPAKDYRYDEQRRAADQNQKELTREIRKGY